MGIFVYPHDCTDFSTTGLCGDLRPIEAYFEEEKNGISQIEMTLQYDPYGKWKEVKVGRYIGTMVPVRMVPAIENDSYSKTVQKVKIKTGVSKVYVDKTCQKVMGIRETEGGGYSLFEPSIWLDPEASYVQSWVAQGIAAIVTDTTKVYVYQDDYEIIEQVEIPAALDGIESITGTSRLKPQFFIITSVEKTLEGLLVTAKHVFYELLHNATTYKTENIVQGAAACRQVFDNLVSEDNRFEIFSDCTDEHTGLDYDRLSPIQALLDPEEGICKKYGLSLIRDNYTIFALKNVGTDRGFAVEYGKNMLSVDCIENIDETYTRIIPFGKDKKGNPVYMDGQIWVDSERINDYPAPRVLMLDCTDTAAESAEMNMTQVKEELKKRAQEELENGIDEPNMEMTVDFLSLGDTEEYQQYRNLDKVYLYDRITVKDHVHGLDYAAEVVAIRHNLLTGMLESCTIGSLEKASAGRKIASWQVPTVDGSNIQLQSIEPGILGQDAVGTENIQDNAVVADKIIAGAITAEKIDAEAIQAQHLSAEAIAAVFAKIEGAEIDWASISELEAAIASIANMKIGSANINYAHIMDLVAGTAIITQGVSGELYISRLAVTEANMVSLSVGELLLRGPDGCFYALTVDEAGNITTELKQVGNDDVADLSLDGGQKIIEGSITAATLNVKDIFADSAIIRELIAANINVDTLFTREATLEAINTLDIRGNEYLKISVNGLREEIAQAASDATGQQMILSFDQGNTFETEKESMAVSVHVWKNGKEITGDIPPAAFLWERDSGSPKADSHWNSLPEHRGVTEITLSREEVGKSCLIRCILDEEALYGSFEIVDGELHFIPNGDDAFTLENASLYGPESYILKDGYIVREAASKPMQVESGVFDHSIFESSGIYIKDDELKIKSSGNISMEAGSTLSMEGAEINMKAGSAFRVESGGIAHIDAEDGHVNLGEDFSVTDEGSLVAKTGSFMNGIRLGGKDVNPGPEIIVSTTEPEANGILWVKPSSARSVSYSLYTGDARNTMWYDQATGSQTHIFALSPESGDVMTSGTFLYTLRLPLYEIREARQKVKINISAQKASGGDQVVFPEYIISDIRQWQEMIVEVSVESNVNLGGDTTAINATIAMDGVESNNGLYLQKSDRISLSMVNKTATESVMPCEIFWKP